MLRLIDQQAARITELETLMSALSQKIPALLTAFAEVKEAVGSVQAQVDVLTVRVRDEVPTPAELGGLDDLTRDMTTFAAGLLPTPVEPTPTPVS